jgi:hypothetical protein
MSDDNYEKEGIPDSVSMQRIANNTERLLSMAVSALTMAQAMGRLAEALEGIERLLQSSIPTNESPNFTADLHAFPDFDWSSIDATVEDSDEFGPRSVRYSGKSYFRRSPENKYAEAIWYSRSTGVKDEDGKTVFARLITFKKPVDVGPISRGAEKAISSGPKPEQSRPSVQAPAAPASPAAPTVKATAIDKRIERGFRQWAAGLATNSGKFLLADDDPDIDTMMLILGAHGIETVNAETAARCKSILMGAAEMPE